MTLAYVVRKLLARYGRALTLDYIAARASSEPERGGRWMQARVEAEGVPVEAIIAARNELVTRHAVFVFRRRSPHGARSVFEGTYWVCPSCKRWESETEIELHAAQCGALRLAALLDIHDSQERLRGNLQAFAKLRPAV